MAIASPLTKRGLQLRIGYVWGQGVSVQGRSAEADGDGAGQDVNTVVQAFWDDPDNQVSLTSSQAQETNERTLGTDSTLCFAFFPGPLTGRVQVRTVPFEEIQDKITNPDDRADVWFFYRQYTTAVIEPGYAGTTRRRSETRRVRTAGSAAGGRGDAPGPRRRSARRCRRRRRPWRCCSACRR
jgi:hypothetical protein